MAFAKSINRVPVEPRYSESVMSHSSHTENFASREYSHLRCGFSLKPRQGMSMAKVIPGIYQHTRAWREYRNLTQEQVANILGISNNGLSEKERGVRKFKPEELEKLAEIYDCEPWMLLAMDPNDERLSALRKAVELVSEMSPKQAATWAEIGDTMIRPEK